jgi:1-acyl-sn-glycerol-3-phosphate acyltransferase
MIFRLRSILFDLFFYTFTTMYLIFFLPFALWAPRKLIFILFRAWTRICIKMLAILVGLHYTVRGREHLNATTQNGACIIACKHQSAFDTIFISMYLDDIVIISKGQLASVPFFGYYLKKLGTIFIDRENKTSAIRDLIKQSREAISNNRSLFIFPEGTRAKPGESIPYQRGISLLYRDLNVPVIPVALNTGVFWGRKSMFKRPGMIVIDIQPAIPSGLERDHFMDVLQKTIDIASYNLLDSTTEKRKKKWLKKLAMLIFGLSLTVGFAGYFGTKALLDHRLNKAGITFATSKIHLGMRTLPTYELTNVTLNLSTISESMITAQFARLTLTGLKNFTLEAQNINVQLHRNIFITISDLEAFIAVKQQKLAAPYIPHIGLKNVIIRVGGFTSTLNAVEAFYNHEYKINLLDFSCSTPRSTALDTPILIIKSSVFEQNDNTLKGNIAIQTTFGAPFIDALQQQGIITNTKANELKVALKPIEHESNQNLRQIVIPIEN